MLTPYPRRYKKPSTGTCSEWFTGRYARHAMSLSNRSVGYTTNILRNAVSSKLAAHIDERPIYIRAPRCGFCCFLEWRTLSFLGAARTIFLNLYAGLRQLRVGQVLAQEASAHLHKRHRCVGVNQAHLGSVKLWFGSTARAAASLSAMRFSKAQSFRQSV